MTITSVSQIEAANKQMTQLTPVTLTQFKDADFSGSGGIFRGAKMNLGRFEWRGWDSRLHGFNWLPPTSWWNRFSHSDSSDRRRSSTIVNFPSIMNLCMNGAIPIRSL